MPSPRQILATLLRHPLGAGATITANLIPIVGVLVYGWDAAMVVILYWLENIVVGSFNVLKMILCQPDPSEISKNPLTLFGTELNKDTFTGPGGEGVLIPFFIVHYGIFTAVHGFFVYSLFERGKSQAMVARLDEPFLLIAVGALVLSHLFELLADYLIGGGNRKTNRQALFVQPYGRVLTMHSAVLLGGLFADSLGNPSWVLVVLVVVKTLLDLFGLAITLPRGSGAPVSATGDQLK